MVGSSAQTANEPETIESSIHHRQARAIYAYRLSLPQLPIWLVHRGPKQYCTTVLTARSGARYDPEFGGSAARAALLATCRLIADQPFPNGSIFTHCEQGGDDAIIWIHHRPQDLFRLLQRLPRIFDGTPASKESLWALQQLLKNQRPHSDPCSCITACYCSPHQRLRQRMVEALDPLPAGARRSGCSRRIKNLSPSEIDRWRIKYIRLGNIALTIETSLDLRQLSSRQHVAPQVRSQFETTRMTFPSQSYEAPEARRYIEPTKTIISPPIIESARPQRVIAGWIVDRASPPEAIPLLNPRVEIWDEIVLPNEPAQRSLLRLKARRRACRIDHLVKNHSQGHFKNSHLAIQLLRRNDPGADSVLSRKARRAPIVTVLRHERWP